MINIDEEHLATIFGVYEKELKEILAKLKDNFNKTKKFTRHLTDEEVFIYLRIIGDSFIPTVNEVDLEAKFKNGLYWVAILIRNSYNAGMQQGEILEKERIKKILGFQ